METTKSTIQSRQSQSFLRLRIFEEAREAITKLKTLKPLLSSQDEETLSILMDKELLNHIGKSLKDAQKGKLEPLANILK